MINLPTMAIRTATVNDLPSIVEIYNQTIASRMVTAETEPVTVKQKQDWFDKHDSQRPIFIYEQHNKVLGWLSFSSFYGRPAYAGTCEISVYVHHLTRGNGIGWQLLKFAERHSHLIDVNILLAFIFSHNSPSIHLFEKLGYVQWGELPDVATMDNRQYSLTILGKTVDKK
jgi:L-amino acid N-acyltransferase YncA